MTETHQVLAGRLLNHKAGITPYELISFMSQAEHQDLEPGTKQLLTIAALQELSQDQIRQLFVNDYNEALRLLEEELRKQALKK